MSALILAEQGSAPSTPSAGKAKVYVDNTATPKLRLIDDAASAAEIFDNKHSVLLASPSLGIGFTTGAGSTVTQGVDKTTAVSINAMCGDITTHNATLNDLTLVSFTVNNTSVAATDNIIITHKSGGTLGAYAVWANTIAANSFVITLKNISGGNLGEALVIRFTVIKGVTS
jgi:hypothetical protein